MRRGAGWCLFGSASPVWPQGVLLIMYARLCCRGFVVVVVLLCSTSACRRHDPPPLVAKNLGTPDRPLLPFDRRGYDASILKGKAVPQRAAELVEEEPETAEVGEGEISDEDRELIEELVELAREAQSERRFEDLVELLVLEQREAGARIFEQVSKLLVAFEGLGSAMDEKVPGAGTAISQQITAQLSTPLTISDLRMTDSDKATASTSIGKRVDFWLVDDEWYLRDPDIPDDPQKVEQMVEIFSSTVEKIEDLTSKVEEGDVAPAAAGTQIMGIVGEMAMRMSSVAPEAAGGAATAEPAEEAPDEDEAEKDEEGEEEEPADAQPPASSRGRRRGPPDIS